MHHPGAQQRRAPSRTVDVTSRARALCRSSKCPLLLVTSTYTRHPRTRTRTQPSTAPPLSLFGPDVLLAQALLGVGRLAVPQPAHLGHLGRVCGPFHASTARLGLLLTPAWPDYLGPLPGPAGPPRHDTPWPQGLRSLAVRGVMLW